MVIEADKLELEVSVKGFKEFMKAFAKADDAMGRASKRWTGLSKVASNAASILGKVAKVGILGIAGSATAAAGAIGGVTVALGKMAMEAAPVQGLQSAFEGLTSSIEGGSDAMLKSLQEASGGMIANRDLMESFNKASSLVSKDFAQQLPDAMQYLSKVAASTGQDMGFMMDSLVTGVGRLSPMILDNLAIQVNATEANEAYAEAMGLSVKEMTKEQQQAAMMNQVLEKLAANTADMPDVTGSAAQGMASFGTMIQNLKDDIGLAFLPVLQIVMGELSKLASKIGPKVTEWARMAGKWLGEKLPGAIDTVSKSFELIWFAIQSLMGGDIAGVLEGLDFAIRNLFGDEVADRIFIVLDAIQNFLIPAFQNLGTWIQETAIPAFQRFVTFIQENAEPILAGIAAALVAVVIPAFIAWAAGAIAAATATAAALAPLIIPIVAIGAAVALLVKAWKEDWGGIQEKTKAVVAFLKQLWEEVLLPALLKIWDFIRLQIIPLFEKLARIAIQIVGRAIEQLTDIWNNVLYPILVMVWEFIQESLIPIFEVLADIAETVLGLAIQVLAGIWQNVFLPALTVVWKFIKEKVLPIFTKVREEVAGKLTPAFEFLTNKILPVFQRGIEAISNVLRIFYDWLKRIQKILDGMDVPDWARGHSPPPLATWFRDISDEVERLAAAELPRLAASFDLAGGRAVPASAAVGASVTNNYNNYNNYNLTTTAVTRPGGLKLEFDNMAMASR